MRRPIPQTDADVAELRDIAELFSQQGKRKTADFIRAVATRYEIVAGAYRTAAAALASDERQPLDAEEIDKLAQSLNVWNPGALSFDFRRFARLIESHHGIAQPTWQAAREYCS